MNSLNHILVTGGAGYVGAVLVPKLLQAGYAVTVLDLCMYGEEVLDAVRNESKFTLVKGDIRDRTCVFNCLKGVDVVIHLACISNDPSYELNPDLSKTINYDATLQLIDAAKEGGVKRFIFASSSSVYGVKDEENVTEDLPLEPLTDYSKYKALCEDYVLGQQSDAFIPVVLRPATVCGYSPRQRLDLTVNILTNHAVHNKKIRIFGGEQKRPNIHIDDVTDLYVKMLSYADEKIAGKIFNAGYENHAVREIATMVKEVVADNDIVMVTEPSDDKRSYHISSEKIHRELGFVPKHSIAEAIADLRDAFSAGKLPDAMNNERYYNIRMMQKIELT